MNEYCLYFHKKTCGEIFYVGIGKHQRAFDFRNARSKFWHSLVKKHGDPIVEIVLENVSWEHACFAERWCIRMFGRRDQGQGTLVNLTDGGDGVPHWGTPEQRSLNAKNRRGNAEKAEMMRSQITHEHAVRRSITRWKNMTADQRTSLLSIFSRQAKEQWKSRTAEEKAVISQRRLSSMTSEERSEMAKKGKRTMTPEQRSEAVRKSWITRKSNR